MLNVKTKTQLRQSWFSGFGRFHYDPNILEIQADARELRLINKGLPKLTQQGPVGMWTGQDALRIAVFLRDRE